MIFFVLAVFSVLFFALWKVHASLTFWKRMKVRQPNIGNILWANFSGTIRSISLAELCDYQYRLFPNDRYMGGYQHLTPMLVVRSPELIKQILVRDFDHFLDHPEIIAEDADPLWSKHLLSLKGDDWREMRSILTPSFTRSKMKVIRIMITECAGKFVDHFDRPNTDILEIEAKDAFTRYANDVIASFAFGIEIDSLAARKNAFYLMGKEVSDMKGFWFIFKLMISHVSPKLFKFLGLRLFSKSASNFFMNLIKDSINIREERGIIRHDMIYFLMKARNRILKEKSLGTLEEDKETTTGKGGSAAKKEITDEDMAAQAFIFFMAGFDIVATVLSFMAYELCANPDVQQKLYEDITQKLEEDNGELVCETLHKMKYLDMVISETLRKWPPTILLDRVCTKPYTIQPEKSHEGVVHIDKGLFILIPQFAIHHDEKHFPEPERFDPERFNDENKTKINPYAYLPFGIGPRNCIGYKFALLEIKIIFVKLLTKFELVPTAKTQIPLKLSKDAVALDSENGFWLGLKSRMN